MDDRPTDDGDDAPAASDVTDDASASVVDEPGVDETVVDETVVDETGDEVGGDRFDPDSYEYGYEYEYGAADDDGGAPRHNALPRRVENWRTRTATGAVMSAMAMGLHQVFHKEQEKPAIVQEAPSDPYDDDDPVIVDYVADDAEGTTVTLRPWLLKKDEG